MIIAQIKDIKSGRKTLKWFGITMGIVLGLLGGLFFWRGRGCYPYLLIISAVFISLGLVVPILLKPVHKAWMALGIILNWLMVRVMLSFLFYLVVTPIGLMTRLFGKDFLRLKFNRKDVNSYWLGKSQVKLERSNYEKQF